MKWQHDCPAKFKSLRIQIPRFSEIERWFIFHQSTHNKMNCELHMLGMPNPQYTFWKNFTQLLLMSRKTSPSYLYGLNLDLLILSEKILRKEVAVEPQPRGNKEQKKAHVGGFVMKMSSSFSGDTYPMTLLVNPHHILMSSIRTRTK